MLRDLFARLLFRFFSFKRRRLTCRIQFRYNTLPRVLGKIDLPAKRVNLVCFSMIFRGEIFLGVLFFLGYSWRRTRHRGHDTVRFVIYYDRQSCRRRPLGKKKKLKKTNKQNWRRGQERALSAQNVRPDGSVDISCTLYIIYGARSYQ